MKTFAAAMTQVLMFFSLSAQAEQWNFNVTVDGRPVGTHIFKLTHDGDHKTLESEANFNVKILFFNAYRYHHIAKEDWRGDCLQGLQATTRENDKETKINGQQTPEGFVLSANGLTEKNNQPLGNCVMTFAYWNPKLLTQTKLLNPQTGEYLASKISALGDEEITVRGVRVPAKRYVIDTPKFKITLWYGASGDWLALQSTGPDGRKVLYSLR